jgi:hypothetical protein
MKEIRWLWPGRIPYGMLTIIEGPPKRGKSLIAIDVVARLSTGQAMPESDAPAAPCSAVILNPEDPVESVVGPRLAAAGADRSRVFYHRGFIKRDSRGDDYRFPLVLSPENIGRLGDDIDAIGARLVVVDAVMGLIPSTKSSNNDQEIRSVLEPLARLAESRGIAIVIGRHWSKGATNRASHERGLGSIAFTGVARSVLQVGHMPGDKSRRVLGVGATNSLEAPPLEFRAIGRQVELEPRRFKFSSELGKPTSKRFIEAPAIEWIGPLPDFDLETLDRRDAGEPGEGAATQEASCSNWLLKRLEELGGEAPSAQLEREAGVKGFHPSTLKRAKIALCDQGLVASRRHGEGWRVMLANTHHIQVARDVFD